MTADYTRDFVEELLRSGLTLADLLSHLIETLPDDAFPGEDTAAVLVEMLTGSVRPAALAAGERTVREATALMAAAVERALTDLRLAAERAR